MSGLVEERKEFALKLLKEAEFEIIELIRDTPGGPYHFGLHDAKMAIWNAMERVEAISAQNSRTASVPSSERGKTCP